MLVHISALVLIVTLSSHHHHHYSRVLVFETMLRAPTTMGVRARMRQPKARHTNRIRNQFVRYNKSSALHQPPKEEEEESHNKKKKKEKKETYVNTWDATLPPSIVVVVEGLNDARRVRKALNISHPDAVFAINRGGKKQRGYFDKKANTWKLERTVVEEVERKAGWMRDDSKRAEVVIFTDPDVAGRQYRQNFIKYLPLAKHAFVSRYRARCKKETNWHDVNDCGVEFATDGAIRVALKQARTPKGRYKWMKKAWLTKEELKEKAWITREELEERGLRQSHLRKLNLSNIEGEVSAKRLRQVLGNVLGIGECDAKQLLRQLNMFFSPEEFEEAMKNTVELLESGKADEWDFTVGSDEEDFGFDPNAYIPPGQAPPGFE